MVFAFDKALGLGLAMGATSMAAPAIARDDPPPPPPCPLTTTLRVADAASLTGILSLSQCSNIIATPARSGEFAPPPDVRIVEPQADRPEHTTASFQMASADAKRPAKTAAASPAPVQPVGTASVQAIAPSKNEPVSIGQVDAGAILAMHPVSYTTRYDSIDQESRYRANAVSPVGARGLMQLMPGTARMLNVRGTSIVDAEANVDGGARLLRQLHGRFNDFNLTLAAYNAGEGAVRRYGNRVPPYPETQNYVRGVMARYERLVSEQAAGAQ
jgi:soluble lytic murein transglycosylase-like protein